MSGHSPYGTPGPRGGNGLADILERVLDKGVVIAGDIALHLVGIELLTIRIRLVITSVDKAQELGIGWWQTDSFLSSGAAALEARNRDLELRVKELEARLGSIVP